MRQEVYSKGKEMHNEMSGRQSVIFKEEDDDGRNSREGNGRRTSFNDYEASQQRSNFGGSQVEQ